MLDGSRRLRRQSDSEFMHSALIVRSFAMRIPAIPVNSVFRGPEILG